MTEKGNTRSAGAWPFAATGSRFSGSCASLRRF